MTKSNFRANGNVGYNGKVWEASGQLWLALLKSKFHSARCSREVAGQGVSEWGSTQNRPALNMDWWRMEWPFSRVQKYVSEAEICRKITEIPWFLPNFRLRDFEFQSLKKAAIPYPQPFHTPTRLPPTKGYIQEHSPHQPRLKQHVYYRRMMRIHRAVAEIVLHRRPSQVKLQALLGD